VRFGTYAGVQLPGPGPSGPTTRQRPAVRCSIIGDITSPNDTGPDPEGRAPDLTAALGGPLGIVETSAPAIAFAAAYGFAGTNTAAVIAVGITLVLCIARLVRRESPRHALSGLVGVAFAAFIAARSGRAENFYLPGLLANAGYAAAFLVSIALRRPLVGVIVGQLQGREAGWRDDPVRLRRFTLATWVWAGVFLVRLIAQLPLYLAHAVVLLGVVRTAMGLPLFALGIWVTWRLVRQPIAPPAVDPA
jgi:hypothetical protein